MKSLKALFVTSAIAATAALAFPAMAQKFPDKPVKVILPYPVGVGPDTVMRHVADKLSRMWGQPVTVDNRPGGNGWIAVDAVKKAAPDGYTLLQTDTAMFGLQPNIFRKLPFDPVADFDPVSPMYWTHFVIVVGTNSPWNNMADLMAAAKVKSGAVSYASSGVGSQAHLGGAALETSAGVQMTHVPFKDTVQALTSVSTGEIGWILTTMSTGGPLVKANKLKFLALAAPQRHPNFADVPTVAEAKGPSDYEMKTWVSLFAPHGTPKPIIDKINADVAKALGEADVRERLTTVGFTPWPAAPTVLATQLQADIKQYADINKRVKISID